MRILVTGGAGFIGSHLARRLIQEGHEVIVVDNLSTGFFENVPPQAEFIQQDLSTPDFTSRLPGGSFDVVCHLAAQSSGEISGENPLYDVQANALSTLLLSRWSLKAGVRRFLYASSMAIYGDPQELPVKESTPCRPLSYYGISKLTSEHYLRLTEGQGLHSTSFRMFSVYGPGQNLQNLKQGIVSIFLTYMLRNVEIPVTGPLTRFRDLIYIDDVVDAWSRSLRIPSSSATVYNLGAGKPTTIQQLLQALLRALGRPADYPIRELPGSPTDQFGLYADITEARKDLSWQPKTDFEGGIGRMVQWAQSLAPEAYAIR